MTHFKIFLRKTPLFVASEPRQITLGNEILHQKFIFDLSMITSLYLSLIKILEIFRENETDKKIDKLAESEIYFWEMSDCNEVLFYIKNGQVKEFEQKFDYFQFNELIYAFSLLIIPSLSLQNDESEFFLFFLEAEVQDFIQLKSLKNFKKFVLGTSYESNSYKLFCLFNFYADVLFVIWRLQKFINHGLLPNSLTSLLN